MDTQRPLLLVPLGTLARLISRASTILLQPLIEFWSETCSRAGFLFNFPYWKILNIHMSKKPKDPMYSSPRFSSDQYCTTPISFLVPLHCGIFVCWFNKIWLNDLIWFNKLWFHSTWRRSAFQDSREVPGWGPDPGCAGFFPKSSPSFCLSCGGLSS